MKLTKHVFGGHLIQLVTLYVKWQGTSLAHQHCGITMRRSWKLNSSI